MRTLDEISKDIYKVFGSVEVKRTEKLIPYLIEAFQQLGSVRAVYAWLESLIIPKHLLGTESKIAQAIRIGKLFDSNQIRAMGCGVALELTNNTFRLKYPKEHAKLVDAVLQSKIGAKQVRACIYKCMQTGILEIPMSIEESRKLKKQRLLELSMQTSLPFVDYKALYEEAQAKVVHYETLEAIRNSIFVGANGFFSDDLRYRKEQYVQLDNDPQYCATLFEIEKPYNEINTFELKSGFRKAANKYHPDKGGRPEDMVAIQRALKYLQTLNALTQLRV